MEAFTFRFPGPGVWDPLERFRQEARAMTSSSGIAFQRLLAVGALYDPQQGLDLNDRFHFLRAMHVCALHNRSIAPTFSLTAMNWEKDRLRQDFLNPEVSVSADLVMVFNVFHPMNADHAANFAAQGRISPYAVDPAAWGRALERTGASMAILVGGPVEVTGETVLAYSGTSYRYPKRNARVIPRASVYPFSVLFRMASGPSV